MPRLGCGIFGESLSTPDAEGRSAKEKSITAEDRPPNPPSSAAPRLLLRVLWRHTAHPDPHDPSCGRRWGCARLRTHILSVSPSHQATEKLKTSELWGLVA